MMTAARIAQLNKSRLALVLPELRTKAEQIIALAKLGGHTLLVTQGFRSFAEQNALYAQGRTKRGKIVTNARGGQSKHNYGRAVDFCFIVGGEVSWDDRLYDQIGIWAKTVGVVWGGNWRSIKDRPHIEI